MHGVHSRRLARFATMLLALGGAPVLAQQPSQQVLDKAAMEIRLKNQKVDAALLARDQAVIKVSFPAIQANFKGKGFNEADVNAAVVTGWKDLRAGPGALTRFNDQTFKVMVTKLGKVRIESKPREANIDIDGIRQDEKTDTAKWLALGTYLILLTKDDYFPEEERRNVIEGENPAIIKTLRRRPK